MESRHLGCRLVLKLDFAHCLFPFGCCCLGWFPGAGSRLQPIPKVAQAYTKSCSGLYQMLLGPDPGEVGGRAADAASDGTAPSSRTSSIEIRPPNPVFSHPLENFPSNDRRRRGRGGHEQRNGRKGERGTFPPAPPIRRKRKGRERNRKDFFRFRFTRVRAR